MFIFRGAHVGQQHLLWRFVHHLPNYARESRITSWWPFKHAASITESLLRTDFFCKAYWPTPFNMHFDFRPLFRITFAELSRKYPHSQTPAISRGCTEGKAKTRGLGVWLSQTLTFGNLVTATRILWCPSPAGPRASVAGTFAKLSRNKLLLSRTRKKLSRGFPTEHARLSQLKLLTRTFRSITNFRGCDSNPKTSIPQVAIQQVAIPIISDPSYKACNPEVAIQVEVAIPVPKPASHRLRFNSQPALRRLRINSQPASCDSSPKTCIPQVAIQFATCTPQVATQFATCKLRLQSQNLHPAGCDSIRNLHSAGCDSIRNLQVAIPVPKPASRKLRFQSQNLHPAGCDSIRNLHSAGCDSIRNLQVAIPVPKPASRRLRFNSQPTLRRLRLNSQPASCDSSPKTCIPQIAIQFATCTPQVATQFATCKLRFQTQNLHPAGCDSIRNLHSAGCDSIRNLQVAIPVPKPASRRLRFNSQLALRRSRLNSQPASCDFSPKTCIVQVANHPADCDSIRNLHSAGCRLNSQPASCDSSPKTCIPQVAIQFATCTPQVATQFATCKLRFQSQNLHPAGCDLNRNLQVAIPVPKPASRRLRFNSQPALRRLRLNSQPASCDSSPKTCIPQVAIQFATYTPQVATQFATCKLRFQSQKPATCRLRFTSRLRFQSQNLHPAGCDSIRNLQGAIPIPPKKPATHTGCDSSRGCDSSPKNCIPQVAIPIPIISFTLQEVGTNLFWFPFLPLEDPALSCLLCKSSANMSVFVKWMAKMDDLGGTSISGNLHIDSSKLGVISAELVWVRSQISCWKVPIHVHSTSNQAKKYYIYIYIQLCCLKKMTLRIPVVKHQVYPSQLHFVGNPNVWVGPSPPASKKIIRPDYPRLRFPPFLSPSPNVCWFIAPIN